MKTRSTRGRGAVADAVREEREKCVCVLGKCQALGIPWSTKLTSFPPFWSFQTNEKAGYEADYYR